MYSFLQTVTRDDFEEKWSTYKISRAKNLCLGHVNDLQVSCQKTRVGMYRTNAITLFHHIESLIDFRKSLPMRDKFIDFKCSRQIILNKGRQFRTSLDPTKSRSPPHTTSNQLKRSRLNLLSG